MLSKAIPPVMDVAALLAAAGALTFPALPLATVFITAGFGVGVRCACVCYSVSEF